MPDLLVSTILYKIAYKQQNDFLKNKQLIPDTSCLIYSDPGLPITTDTSLATMWQLSLNELEDQNV